MRIFIKDVNYSPPGKDLDKEYALIASDEKEPVNLLGWTLEDHQSHIFHFPDFVLNPNCEVKVWVHQGNNDSKNLFWGRRQAVWTNTGDQAFLRNPEGRIIHTVNVPVMKSIMKMENWKKYGIATEDGKVWVANMDKDIDHEILYYNQLNGSFWIGDINQEGIRWGIPNNFSQLGDLISSTVKIWVGDFMNSGKSQILIYRSKQQDWHIAWYSDNNRICLKVSNQSSELGDILRKGVHIWTGSFQGGNLTRLLAYCADINKWYFGAFNAEQLYWKPIENWIENLDLLKGAQSFLKDSFSGKDKTELLFYCEENGDWYIGELIEAHYVGNSTEPRHMEWKSVSNQSTFPKLSLKNMKVWTGNFTGSGNTDLLVYNAELDSWFIGVFKGKQLSWQLASNNTGMCKPTGSDVCEWTGDFTGAGSTELLIYNSDEGKWYIGRFTETQLNWTLANNSNEFGNLLSKDVRIWANSFIRYGKTEILFYNSYTGDWRIGSFNGTQFSWALVDNSADFRDLQKGNIRIWTGDFSGNGIAELLFYCADNGNWYVGRFSDGQLSWRFYSATYALREDYAEHGPFKVVYDMLIDSFSWLADLGIDIINYLAELFGFESEEEASFNTLIFYAGFDFDEDQKIFYSRKDPWQRNGGYFSLYDEGALLVAIKIHCEPIYFEYRGEDWKIELWKGQYGICTGAEIGIYKGYFQGPDIINRTVNEKATQCAGNDDMLQMSFVLKKNNEIVFKRDSDNKSTSEIEKHWWLTGFKPFEKSEASELRMEIKITLKDTDMCSAFVDALAKVGYSKDDEISVDGTTVSFAFDRPYTKQPEWANWV